MRAEKAGKVTPNPVKILRFAWSYRMQTAVGGRLMTMKSMVDKSAQVRHNIFSENLTFFLREKRQ